MELAYVADQSLHLLCRLPVRALIIALLAKELIPPDRHMTGSVRGDLRLPVDDAKDLLIRELATMSRTDLSQVRDLDVDEFGNWTITTGVIPMAARTMELEKNRPGVAAREAHTHLVCAGG